MKKRKRKEALSVMKKYLEQFDKILTENSEEVKLLPEESLIRQEVNNKPKQKIRK